MRSKEAIAILRGFCKREARGADGDPFAKGILAAIRWMTEEDSPVPYAELTEDMPEDGGWLGEAGMISVPAPAMNNPVPKTEPSRIVTLEQYQQETRPRTPEYQPEPIVSAGSDDLDLVEAPSNPNLLIADKFSTKLAENPWLRGLLSIGADGQGKVPITDTNAVAVGMGLEDEPYFQGGGRD